MGYLTEHTCVKIAIFRKNGDIETFLQLLI